MGAIVHYIGVFALIVAAIWLGAAALALAWAEMVFPTRDGWGWAKIVLIGACGLICGVVGYMGAP